MKPRDWRMPVLLTGVMNETMTRNGDAETAAGRSSRRVLLTLLVLLIVLFSPRQDAAHAEVTRAQFIAQADPICAEVNAQDNDLKKRLEKKADSGRYLAGKRVLAHNRGLIQGGLLRVELLERPPADADFLATNYFDLTRQATQLDFSGWGKFFERHYQASNRAFKLATQLNARRNAVMAGYGFQVCATT